MGSGSHPSKRKKKRSQKRSKKRSRSGRDKSKKLKRHDDSFSCSDEDSTSTSSLSCSSSGDEYRSKRRARRGDRRDRKDGKKWKTRSSSVSESKEDSRPVKKRKRSKKSRGSDIRKKSRGKKRRRVPSSSSSSDGSSESEIERKGEKLEGEERNQRGKNNERSGRKRSCSSFSFGSESCSYHSEERVMEENNPKRLKSVIVVTKEREEDELGGSDRDEHKDEIVYEHDDYPTKSNDSNDASSRREVLSYSHDVTSEKKESINDQNREAVASDVGTSEFLGNRRLAVEDTGGITSSRVGLGVEDHLEGYRSEVFTPNTGSNRDDLEAMLRQKALENLLKRQGKFPAQVPARKECDYNSEVKKSSSLKTELVQHMPDGKGSAEFVEKVGKVDNVKYTGNVLSFINDNEGNFPSYVSSRSELCSSTIRKEFLGAKNTWKRQLIPQESSQRNPSAPQEAIEAVSRQRLILEDTSQPNLSAPKISVDKDAAWACESLSLDAKASSEKVDKFAAAGGQSSNAKTDQADEDSQFQQKTMSVMRGGEMVQVSYKVYIPKKAPALTRRQLKR